jgi:Lrp/AsnC family transcriptional regulator, cysteine-sensing transcriptional activator
MAHDSCLDVLKDAITVQLDKVDRDILSRLQVNASLSAAELCEKVALSASQCWRRVERLEKEGIILKRVALLDRKKVGLNLMLFAHVKLGVHGRDALPEFSKAIQKFPEVLECYVLLGNVDFILRIVAADIEAYERFFFQRLSRLPMIQEVNTMIALSQIKSTTALPLDDLPGA